MKNLILLAAFAGASLAPHARAQSSGAPITLPPPEAMEVSMLRISATTRCGDACVVRNAPYSAERHYRTDQLLADGNRINTERVEKIYRDTHGRTRVESTWLGQPLIQIQDPVAGLSYRLYPHNRSGLVMRISAAPARSAAASEPAVTVAVGASSAGAVKVAQQLAPALAAAAPAGEKETKALGAKIMEGVSVEGQLQTTVVPAGAAGNALPISVSYETWRSAELDMMIYWRNTDPRTGERTMRITDLSRREPPAALFAPPPGYTVREVARVR